MARTTFVEVCLDSAESARDAESAGADRVELCDDLVEGGTTPSAGMIEITRNLIDIGLHVMIRPRGGDFVYSEVERDVMAWDVLAAKERGADGVVFGLLRPDGTIDAGATARLVDLARPMVVTFHRAFDMARDAFEGLETLAGLGVERVLTSGQEADVLDGLDLVRRLVEASAGRVGILPGCGIDETNVARVVAATGVGEVHVALPESVESSMARRNPRIFMGTSPGLPEYARMVTSRARLERLIAALA